MQALVSLFLAILFLQSGTDKVMDWRGNLGYLQPHFAKSPLASVVPAILLIITILEVSAGTVNGVGFLELLVLGKAQIAFWERRSPPWPLPRSSSANGWPRITSALPSWCPTSS